MIVARSNTELAQALDRLGPTAFVPTMGALHAGHASLIQHAASHAAAHQLAGASVSIFVNPTQFNDPRDLERYPRPESADLALCESSGAALVYLPRVHDIYPPNDPIPTPPLPEVATRPGLEDAHRPGHFAGVCQVVARLFSLVRPAAALFGEKDWQQLAVIRAMSALLTPEILILPRPTLRDPDGLAMSSRNAFLTPADRTRALALSRALARAASQPTPRLAEEAMHAELALASITPEYAVVRDADTLLPTPASSPARALIAARVGSVRLIDNAAWPGPS